MKRAARERNPLPVAATGIVLIVALFLAAFYAKSLPVIGGGNTYTAEFKEAAGIKSGDEVRIAGVKVGEVVDVGLEDRHVRVDFRVKNAWVGDQSTAAIKIKTVLGQKYLAVDPLGPGALADKGRIPLVRTTAPFDVNDAFNGLATTVGDLDTGQLAKSFTVLSQTFHNTAPGVRQALDGLSSLSKTISSRDTQLAKLLRNTKEITATLSARNNDFSQLFSDGNLLLDELAKRKQAIADLLTGTRRLATELSGLVQDNQAILRPTLEKLDEVADVLARNQSAMDKGLALAGPYYRLLTNTLGSGKWVDSYIYGLFDAQGQPDLDSAGQRDCAPGQWSTVQPPAPTIPPAGKPITEPPMPTPPPTTTTPPSTTTAPKTTENAAVPTNTERKGR